MVLADAGYWHHEQMNAITERGIELLIPPDSSRRKGARPGWEGGAYTAMRERLATDRGAELYGKRQPMIEPVFGQTKFNRRIDRFQRRGRHAARTEWRLITATHNLLKLWRHTIGPDASLSAGRPGRPPPAAPTLTIGTTLARGRQPFTRQPRVKGALRARVLPSRHSRASRQPNACGKRGDAADWPLEIRQGLRQPWTVRTIRL